MVAPASSRILAALELMRLPLVITAISNAQAAFVLHLLRHGSPFDEWPIAASVTLALMSFGLYAFGMVSNDIIDIRRDKYLAPQRPLPSGRLGFQTAHILAAILLLLGVIAGTVWAIVVAHSFASVFFLAWTIILIFFYNLAGKFVGAAGIITLGLIRFFHAAIAQPHLHIVWHPLLLMDHVIILSAICYVLEGKHPKLTIGHRWLAGAGLLGLNIMIVAGSMLAAWLHLAPDTDFWETVGCTSGLLWPITAALVFAAIVTSVILSLRESEGLSHRELLERRRKTGRRLMLFGLLWLVIYDGAFVFGYVR